MDWNALGAGIGIGLVIASIPILIFLPASYVMNRYIYHHWALRFLMGLVVGCLPVISLIAVACMRIFAWGPATFFGLMPLYDAENMELPGGYLTFLYRIFYALMEPFASYASTNPTAYKEAIQPLLVSEDSPSNNGVFQQAVPESFFQDARKAGTIADKTEWTAFMKRLEESGVGKYIFG
jgi:hypothetical protein